MKVFSFTRSVHDSCIAFLVCVIIVSFDLTLHLIRLFSKLFKMSDENDKFLKVQGSSNLCAHGKCKKPLNAGSIIKCTGCSASFHSEYASKLRKNADGAFFLFSIG